MSNQSSILIKTHGLYYFKTENAKGVREFTQEVKAPNLEYFRETNQKYLGTDDNGKLMFKTNSFINVRGQLKKKYLPMLIKLNDPQFVRVRLVTIDEIVPNDNQPITLPVQLMSFPQLTQYAKNRNIPVQTDTYLEIDDLRRDVLEYEAAPDGFLDVKASRDAKRQAEREFMRLNNLLPNVDRNAPKAGASQKPLASTISQDPKSVSLSKVNKPSITDL
jgi:hypothetical protein